MRMAVDLVSVGDESGGGHVTQGILGRVRNVGVRGHITTSLRNYSLVVSCHI